MKNSLGFSLSDAWHGKQRLLMIGKTSLENETGLFFSLEFSCVAGKEVPTKSAARKSDTYNFILKIS
jgi:hypothetical protein